MGLNRGHVTQGVQIDGKVAGRGEVQVLWSWTDLDQSSYATSELCDTGQIL